MTLTRSWYATESVSRPAWDVEWGPDRVRRTTQTRRDRSRLRIPPSAPYYQVEGDRGPGPERPRTAAHGAGSRDRYARNQGLLRWVTVVSVSLARKVAPQNRMVGQSGAELKPVPGERDVNARRRAILTRREQ